MDWTLIRLHIITFLFLSFSFTSKAQNKISIEADLDTLTHQLKVQQKIVYHNNSNDTIRYIFLHNWANSFKSNKTPLGKRFIEDYQKKFYFSDKKEKGYSKIHNISTNHKTAQFKEVRGHPDIIEVLLNKVLLPKDSTLISATYTIKIPNARFTGYGKTKTGYHLRFWYLSPAVYLDKWQIMSNLNMDDLYQDVADFTIDIKVPKNMFIENNLRSSEKIKNEHTNNHILIGKNKKDIILHIDKKRRFKFFQTENTEIKTDIFDDDLQYLRSKKIIQREVSFIEQYAGKHPHPEIFIDANTVNKNSLHEIYGLPLWLKPYPENFRWEMRFFKALSSKYIDDILLLNKRNDYWLSNGIQTFLMMEYIKKYYSDIAILGNFSKLWGLRNYNIAKLKQGDKFLFLYQFSARKFNDQSLTTRADSLSNFNRKVISQYKAGLGLKYLQDYVGDSILRATFKEFLGTDKLKVTNSSKFTAILKRKTDKNLDWFFNDYLQTSKKIDHKIKNVTYTKNKDSLLVTIKDKRNTLAPASLYGIKDKEIKFKTWVSDIHGTKTVAIKTGDFDKLAINYEKLYPEYNSLNNFRNVNNSLLSKPLQFRFFRDTEDPYYNQIFFKPNVTYNFYDGVIFGVNFNNQPIIAHNLGISITPNYATKSNSLTGSFHVNYNHYFNKTKIYKISYGIGGSNYHYNKNLAYNTFTPGVSIEFRRNSLRDVGSKILLTRLIHINKEIAKNKRKTPKDNYDIFNLRYVYNKPNVIKRFQYAINTEFSKNFSKVSTDIRYRKFFNTDKSYTLRLFGGYFINNHLKDTYFNFNLNRSSDYLFEQNLFGRSETTGIFKQQFVTTDGGFKSFFKESSKANEFILAGNSNVSVWRWLEVYNDVAVLKNRHEKPRFFYENGIRLNFVPTFFEFYFPIYTNEGWEVTEKAYPTKIRFIITTNLDRIYNFFRRGIL